MAENDNINQNKTLSQARRRFTPAKLTHCIACVLYSKKMQLTQMEGCRNPHARRMLRSGAMCFSSFPSELQGCFRCKLEDWSTL